MKTLKKIIGLSTFLSFSIAICAINSSTFSWFDKKVQVDSGVIGQSAAAYFAGGDGSKENPFILNNQRHFYNLAWLQYLGYFNKTDENDSSKIEKQYYFKVNNDIDCNGLAIPPIGTEKYPFIGSFDGNNCTISNYTITDTYNTLVSHPSIIDQDGNEYHSSDNDTINYCSIVGTFGVVGSYNSVPSVTYDSTIPNLSNLYLDNVTISTKTSQVLVGCFAGYVNTTIDNCGVHYVKFNIAGKTSKLDSFNNVSEFALIGSYNKEKYKWDEDPDSGGDIGYGTSTDIKALHLSLINNGLNDGTTGKIQSKYVIPFKSENNTLVQGTGDSIIVTTGGSRTQEIKPSEYYTYKASTKGNNLGYYIGEVKTYEMSLDYNIDDFGVQSGTGYNVNRNLKTPPDDILSYLKTNGTHLIRLNNGYSSDNLTGSTFSYVQNGQVGNWTGNLLLPSNGIWVAPKENGTFKFVFYNKNYGKEGNAGSVGILFTELQRVTPGDFSSAFVANTLICSGLSYSCKYGYFEKEAKVGYEYYITFYNTSSYDAPYIAYMDIGVNGGDTPSYDRISLANFDFVTKENNSLTKIKTYDEDSKSYVANSSYTKSNVTFKIGNTTDETIVAFRRLVESSGGVLYYQSNTVLTPSTTGTKTSTTDEDCTS